LEGKVIAGVSVGQFPVVFGHEAAGVVESVGPGTDTELVPGDHVIPSFMAQCRKCSYCQHPKTNMCLSVRATQERGQMPDGTSRYLFLAYELDTSSCKYP
jgi:S-(hydroxymethyl)glutathione dehydrogenase/alcohol dehydrogenase